MKNRQSGFTLLELLIVMGIFMIVIVGVSEMFVSLLSEFKQQSKITMTNIEGMLGLEMMRRDIENAGYGLPWSWDVPVNYNELQTPPDAFAAAHGSFNDAPSGPPRAVLNGNLTGWHGTDRLVVKAVNVAMSSASDRWTHLFSSPVVTTTVWTPATENLSATDRVIVLSQDATNRKLVPHTLGGFSNTFLNVALFSADRSDPSIVYAVDPNTTLKMPFNRADFYVQPPASASDLPAHCAAGTGILYKAVIDHGGNGFLPAQQLLECVADMQVAFLNDTLGDGTNIVVLEDISNSVAYPAQDIRNLIKEVRVYILAQEGQRDKNYTYPNQKPWVGETGIGREFDFLDAAHPIPDWSHYRWKLYTLVVRPSNLK